MELTIKEGTEDFFRFEVPKVIHHWCDVPVILASAIYSFLLFLTVVWRKLICSDSNKHTTLFTKKYRKYMIISISFQWQ